MKINTWSTLISITFTSVLFLFGVRIIVGELQLGDIVASFFLYLPFFVLVFAILYLLASNLLNKIKNHKYIQPLLKNEFLTEIQNEIHYSLPMAYRCLGILLIVSLILLSFHDRPVFMIVMVLFLGIYYLKTPYKIEVENDTFTVFLLSGKRIIEREDIRSVTLGVFHNRVDSVNDHFYLSHFLTNVSALTRNFAQTTGTQNFDQSRWAVIDEKGDSPSFWAYKTIILLIFSILSSVLVVLYFIRDVK